MVRYAGIGVTLAYIIKEGNEEHCFRVFCLIGRVVMDEMHYFRSTEQIY